MSRNSNVTFEEIALEALAKHGYSQSTDPCFLQCFELSSLERLASKTNLRRILLLNSRPKATAETFERIKRAGIFGIGIDKLLLVEIQGEGDEKPGHIKKIHYEIANQVRRMCTAFSVDYFVFVLIPMYPAYKVQAPKSVKLTSKLRNPIYS